MNLPPTTVRHVHFRKPVRLVYLLAWLALLPGCALVTNGFHQSVDIASVPTGATVLIDGAEAGQTPLTVSLSRAHTHRVELRKVGFVTVSQFIRSQAGEYLRRPIRFGLDIDSGAANELTPAVLNVELTPEVTAAASGDSFEQMTAAVLAADDLWHRGAVSEAEHHQMIESILARFAR